MKILICGGNGTNKLKLALENRFKSGMHFCTEELASNIENFIMRGESFDRAIIFEQSLTNNGLNSEAAAVRKTVCNFVAKIKENYTKYELLFITENKDRARMIMEETLDVSHVSAIIVKMPPYATSFITQLVSVELKHFDKGLLFTQSDVRKMIEVESAEEDILWSDEIEKTRGELLGSSEISDEEVIRQLENFKWQFTRRGIEVIDVRDEMQKMQFSDEAKSKRIGNKTKSLSRKG